jgi:hypothetical protein
LWLLCRSDSRAGRLWHYCVLTPLQWLALIPRAAVGIISLQYVVAALVGSCRYLFNIPNNLQKKKWMYNCCTDSVAGRLWHYYVQTPSRAVFGFIMYWLRRSGLPALAWSHALTGLLCGWGHIYIFHVRLSKIGNGYLISFFFFGGGSTYSPTGSFKFMNYSYLFNIPL